MTRKLTVMNFKVHRPTRKSKFTAVMKTKRLKWAKDHKDKDFDFWKLEKISDERMFKIMANKAQLVRCRHAEKFRAHCMVQVR